MNTDFGQVLERIRRDQETLSTHRARCTTRPCARCGIFVCPRCRGEMSEPGGVPYFVGADFRSGTCAKCANQAIRKHELAEAFGTIPKHFAWARFDDPRLAQRVKGERSLERARAALHDSSVLLVGPTKAGKTSLGIAMLHALLDPALALNASEENVRFARGIRFVSSFALNTSRTEYGLGRGEAPTVKSAMEASLLLIDELGGETVSATSAVAHVIYERHNAERPTWITTGVSSEAIVAKYGSGIARRLLDGATFIQVQPHGNVQETLIQLRAVIKPNMGSSLCRR